MRIPIWDSWLWAADSFIAQLPSTRILWLSGKYGSGKTVTAVFLAALLKRKKLVARVHSNFTIRGQDELMTYVPDGKVYTSPYLKKRGEWRKFYPGQQMPVEDAVLVVDEAGIFLAKSDIARDVMAGLRKPNLYFLMPSILPPFKDLRYFELRRVLNWYAFGIPMWEYDWFMMNGPTVAEKSKLYLWRPHRLFGVGETQDFPEDDGGIVDAIGYTLDLSAIRQKQGAAQLRRVVETFTIQKSGVQTQSAIAGGVGAAALPQPALALSPDVNSLAILSASSAMFDASENALAANEITRSWSEYERVRSNGKRK